MTYKFTIPCKLPGLNDYTAAERSGWQAAANMKKRCENIVIHSARSLGDVQIYDRVYMTYTWYEPNQRRDLDNISSFGRKVIQDALVKSKILQNDGWKNISGFQDRFFVDKKNPRIVVEIEELE